jgi:small-conductance mechanosensitive channel
MEAYIARWLDYLVTGGIIAGGVLAGIIVHVVCIRIMKFVLARTKTVMDDFIVKHLRVPLRFIFPLFFVSIAVQFVDVPKSIATLLPQAFNILFTVSFAWMLMRSVSILEEYIKYRFRIDSDDNLSARKIQTQFQFIKRIVVIVIFIITLAIILMSFTEIRQLGTTLLASAGVVGLIIGFAAQRFLGTLFAGFQIAFTQPIRINDVVIVENEWGWIEEISLTYVVVRVWDLRRLVVPIGYFIEKPFQNWTRTSSEILGTVFVYTDYTIPVEEVREELSRLCKESTLWDGKVCGLQVTDAKERTLELRALVSAEDSGKCWNLRCEIREKLVAFITTKQKEHLPLVRAVLNKED